MFRYVGLAWDGRIAEHTDTAQQLSRAFQSRAQWQAAFMRPGLHVFTTGSRPEANGSYLLPAERGVIVGKLFRRSDFDHPVLSSPELGTQEGDRIVRTGGRALIEDFWGRYVAFLRSGAGDIGLLRDPGGTLPCFWMHFEGVSIVFSWLEDILQILPWTPIPAVNWTALAAHSGEGSGPTRWTLDVQQGMNQPPDLVARGPGDRSVQLTRLNPQFLAKSWGVMGPYGWKDGKGRQWDGGLMIPSGFDAAQPRALVIQTYHFSKDRFYLDGPGAAFSSGFAGRAFLRDDMLVLAMPWAPSTDAAKYERAGVAVFMEGVEGAINALVKSGLVDRERVGILGWSATGERVLNLVAFSSAPIRAASLLDGDANTLFSFTVTYGRDGLQSRKESINEGQPFGASLDRWVRNDPAMHTDCITAALRIETYGPLVLNNWDIYALLRRQYKAAEMVVIPEGAHSLSRPSERMISLQGNVDWYRFWLKGEERTDLVLPGETDAGLRTQYSRWRQMAALKHADDAKPRCALPARQAADSPASHSAAVVHLFAP